MPLRARCDSSPDRCLLRAGMRLRESNRPSQERTLPTQELLLQGMTDRGSSPWRGVETVADLGPFFHGTGLAAPGKVF